MGNDAFCGRSDDFSISRQQLIDNDRLRVSFRHEADPQIKWLWLYFFKRIRQRTAPSETVQSDVIFCRSLELDTSLRQFVNMHRIV